MSLRVTTPPAVEPIDATDVKTHSIIEHSFMDATWLPRAIKAARQRAEGITWRQFITATYTWKLDGFLPTLWVPRPRLQSVTSLKYIDQNGTQQTLVEDTDYTVDADSEPGRVVPVRFGSWPTTYGHIHDVEMIFVAGWGDAATDVPEAILQAMQVMIDHMFEHRDSDETPKAALSLLAEYRCNDPKIARWQQ